MEEFGSQEIKNNETAEENAAQNEVNADNQGDASGAEEQISDVKNDGEGEKKTSVLNEILEIFESVVISVFVVLLIFTFIARPVTVQGKSMYPTLENDDKLIMRMLFYTPQVGDIVVVENE
ncbi:MAG: S24/S26 family peptidase, partial [Oscillospiraceae bacterium]|nr:S24/S26 family peptidase [Oscillospiraceae bacterium]